MNPSIQYDRIEKAIQFLKDNCHGQPSLEETAQHVALSKFHFQRLFERWAGVSPKAFVQYLTVSHAKSLLNKGQSALETAYSVGLSGPGRLHDLFIKMEAVSPGEFKAMGEGVEIVYGFYESLFGEMLVAETPKGVCHLSFIQKRSVALEELRSQWLKARLIDGKGKQAALVFELMNNRTDWDRTISVHLCATPFQIKVWEALLKIPEGRLVSYQDVARMIGQPSASRAVGSAVGKNPIAYLIPCHRVIRETGVIGQYRWGSARKTAMLGWESAVLAKN